MLSYRIDAARGIVELLGSQSVADFEQVLSAVLRDPSYRPGFGFLRNRHGLPALSTGELRRMVDILAHFEGLRGSRWAVIATDPTNYGTIRMAAIFAAPLAIKVGVFEDEASAVQWLAEWDST